VNKEASPKVLRPTPGLRMTLLGLQHGRGTRAIPAR
jgi:hypothetical protein